MRRIIAVLVIAAMGFVGASHAGLGAAAQDATPAALAAHPFVGTWRWDNDPTDPADDSYGIFSADGSYLEVTKPTNVGVGVGTWIPTGERTADALTIFQDTDPSEAFAPGTATFLLSLTVDEAGQTFSGTGDLQVRDVSGVVTFEAAGWTFTGTRVTVTPLPDFGTPVAGTPTG